jgi:class 3 adenylate cyclase
MNLSGCRRRCGPVRHARRYGVATLPSGTVALLLSDVESSTEMWRQQSISMSVATARLDELVAEVARRHDGHVVKARGEGDSHFVVFVRTSQAVEAGADLVRTVDGEAWGGGLSLRVRAAVHVAEVDLRDGDYYGVGVNQTARLRALAHGGQLLVSRAVADIAGHLLAGELELRSLGSHRVRDFPRREEVFQVNGPGQDVEFPPLNAVDMSVPPLAASALIDIVGATAHVAALTHEGLVAQQTKWQRSLQASFDAQHGRYLKLLGDGCLAVFDTPDGAVAFARACKTALASAGATLKGSVHFGPVELLGDDISGQSLWLTTKVLKLADPGQILVSPVARELLRGTVSELKSVGAHRIPGHDLSWELFAAD